MLAGLSHSGRGHLAMLAFSALVAGSFSLGVLAAPHIDPGALSVARDSVRIMSPYFLPDQELISALVTAARRGVAW